MKNLISSLLHTKHARRLADLLDIREGEGLRTFLMFAYIFLIVASLMIIKPVSQALFLSEFGITRLPFAYVLVAVFAAASASLYSRLLVNMPLNLLISRTLKLFVILLFLFRIFFRLKLCLHFVLYAFFVVVAIQALICTSQFWILSNIMFNTREAKRLFGLIGSGAIAGGVFGGYLTKLTANALGSANLTYICMGCLLSCLPIMNALWQRFVTADRQNILIKQQVLRLNREHSIKLLFRSRHLMFLAAIVSISVIAAKLVDYQFSAIASANISDKDQLTAFFGFWMSNLNLLSLLIQIFVTRRIVGVFGVGTSLFVLPLGILIGAVATYLNPALWAAVLIKVSDGSLKNSINKAGMELLTLPIPQEIKNQSKTFIDVFVDSFATGVGGILLIVMTYGLNFSIQVISLVIILLVLIWFFLVTKVKQEYIRLFRLKIENGKKHGNHFQMDMKNESVISGLIKVFETGGEKEIRRAMNMISDIRNTRLVPGFLKLLEHPSPVVKLRALKNLYYYPQADVTTRATKFLNENDHELKTEAFRYLFRRSNDRDAFILPYLNYNDYHIQGAAILCLARENGANQQIRHIFKLNTLIEAYLKDAFSDEDQDQMRFRKITAVQAISVADIPELYPYLHILMNDADPEVVQAAVTGAGDTRHTEFIPLLLKFLGRKPIFRNPAYEALKKYGPGIVDILNDHMKNPYIDRNIRKNIPRVIALSGIQKSVDILIQNLTQGDLSIRYEVIRALNRLRVDAPHLNFDKSGIVTRIHTEAGVYAETIGVLFAQMNAEHSRDILTDPAENTRIQTARHMLIKALEDHLDMNLEIIFRLLGLKYPPDDVYNAYRGIRSSDEDIRISAMEVLDNIIDVNLKKVIMPLIETSMMQSVTESVLKHMNVPVPGEFESITALLASDDGYIKERVLYLLGLLKDRRAIPYIGRLVNSVDPSVRDMARLALRRMEILK